MASRRIGWVLAAALLASCGGKFEISGDDGGIGAGGSAGSGTGGGAGSGTGGAGGKGGAAGAGGSAGTGGSAGAGGSAGTGGSAGAGGSGGAGGSAGTGGSGTGGSGAGGAGGTGTGGAGGAVDGGVDWTACNGPGECVAVAKSCCGSCGAGKPEDYMALNKQYESDYLNQRACTGVLCPAIACIQLEGDAILARCTAGHCEAVDVASEPKYETCATSQDCMLRAGVDCCPACASGAPWVPVSQKGASYLAQDVCSAPGVCDACVATPPTNYSVSCDTGMCRFKAN